MSASNEPYTYSWTIPYGLKVYFGGPEYNLIEKTSRLSWLYGLTQSVKNWVLPKQQHGNIVLKDFKISDSLVNHCDGLVTSDKELGLGVFGSDCPGLILAAPDSLSIAHCGWRGISKGIVKALIDATLRTTKYRVDQLVAFIGPGICGKCYEISSDVVEADNWPEAAITKINSNKYTLDLSVAIKMKLSTDGVHDTILSNICTACDPRLHSYRHQGPGVAQILAVHRL